MVKPFDFTRGAHEGTRHLDAPVAPAILKPLGVTSPVEDRIPRNWAAGEDLDRYRVITGPADRKRSPDITRPAMVVLHGVGYACIFAIGTLLDLPAWDAAHRYGDRFPYSFHARIDIWVPDVKDGPKTSGLVEKATLGHLQRGGDFAKLSDREFNRIRNALLERPTVRVRDGGGS